MSVAVLVEGLRESQMQQVAACSELPRETTYRFDPADEEGALAEKTSNVQKTLRRTVRSLRFAQFQSQEVVRQEPQEERRVSHRSLELARVVPRGARHAYDLIAHVGLKTYLEGWSLTRVWQVLRDQQPRLDIPFSSLYDVQLRFLFYLGALHRQSAPVLREYLQDCGEITWLIDGTLEPGTPVFFGVKAAEAAMMLASWKIASEDAESITACLMECRADFGPPATVLHDLAPVILQACENAKPKFRHRVCEYHLLRDIGEDLYEAPQAALSKRLRAMKLQVGLRDQRKGQLKWLREKLKASPTPLVLAALLQGQHVDLGSGDTLARELLLAMHFWILDYAGDGHRQGFPFDPYLLYFHRRVTRVHDALGDLLAREAVRQQAPQVLFNFRDRLHRYVADSEIVAAASHYERVFALFERLRHAFRLSAQGDSPLRDWNRLEAHERRPVAEALTTLREELRERLQSTGDAEETRCSTIVLTHLDRYWPYLAVSQGTSSAGGSYERTTGDLEREWGTAKQARRQTHGRKKLTRDFHALPKEYMLVSNLRNPSYVERVLGTLEQLPAKLAEAGRTAGPFSHWQKRRKISHCGRLPKRLLRQENLIGNLIDIYDSQCLLPLDEVAHPN